MPCEVLARRQRIQGYEVYLVEQWACSRSHPTFLITTYTGNPDDVILATIISVPTDEEKWSPQMRLYFHSLSEYHARRKETSYGILMVTNLSRFPSSLTVIPVPGGDLKKYREVFIVNENLKRLGCSGRMGIKLEQPNGATQAKFHQLYRTSEKIPFNASVFELVKLCQVALVLFGTLEPEYADGLLCDVTEKAINDWWVEFGADYYTVEPHDGILGPTTVAAILGMLMGARNRLNATNSAIAKDVFDIESTKRSIAHFQKAHHLPKTRRLDRRTLDKLRRTTAKEASKESWAVPRAFKSTVAELGGKGGEMVLGIVGAGQKDGIAEVETVDIDQFVELVRGEHAKWLWHGKPRKTASGDMFDRLPREERSVSPEKHSHSMKPISRVTTLDQNKLTKRDTIVDDTNPESTTPDGIEKERDSKDSYSKRASIKAKSGSGFHHIKNAVGLRSHASKLSRDEHGRHGHHRVHSDLKNYEFQDMNGGTASIHREPSSLSMDDPLSLMSPVDHQTSSFTKVLTETPTGSMSSMKLDKAGEPRHQPSTLQVSIAESDRSTQSPSMASSIAGSIYHGVDLNENLPVEEAHRVTPSLRRTQSGDGLDPDQQEQRNNDYWPRHLSFSIAEESVLRWKRLKALVPDESSLAEKNNTLSSSSLPSKMAYQTMQSQQLKRLYHYLTILQNKDAPWVQTRLDEISALEDAANTDIETLESIYYPRLDTYHALREDTHDLITKTRSQLTASLREMNNVSDKLEYEISALRAKVEDAEDVLGDFERQVEFVESRVHELEDVLGSREGWAHWGLRVLTGIGRKPGT